MIQRQQFLSLLLFAISFWWKRTTGLPSTIEGSVYGEVYVPGDLSQTFSIPLLNGSELSYNVYDTFASRDYFPLTIWSTNFNDPWSKSALLSNDSVDAFLRSDFAVGNSHYLFIAASDEADVDSLKTVIDSRCKLLGVTDIKKSRILYGNISVSNLETAPGIVSTLNQWPSYVNYIQVSYVDEKSATTVTYNITRLDCYWPYCNPVSILSSPVEVVDGGDGCKEIDSKPESLSSQFIVVSADNCTFVEAAVNAQNAGALGVLVMSREGDEILTQINAGGGANLYGIYTTSISYEDGIHLKQILKHSSANITFTYDLIQGYFLVIDGERKIQQIGAPLNAYMMLASWANQYEYFKVQLGKNLSEPAYVLPIIDEKYMNVESKPITIPKAPISHFGSMYIDTTITCPGNFDGDCAQWDHTVTLTVACRAESDDESSYIFTSEDTSLSYSTSPDSVESAIPNTSEEDALAKELEFRPADISPVVVNSRRRRLEVGGSSTELARYVVPFSRRVGRWLTEATQLMSLLTNSECTEFVFDASAGASNWIITTNLRFSSWGQEEQAPDNMASLYSIFEYFRPAYNINRTVTVTVPHKVTRVELEAIISTHGYDAYGCCEFLPTAHIFTINGVEFNVSFDEAGTAWGCSDRVVDGAEPNEYGTWWYGRGNWCDGMDIKPWVIDVSSAIDFESTEETVVDYRALMFFNGSWVPPQSDSQSGYVILSSNLIYYLHNSTSTTTSSPDVTGTLVQSGDDDDEEKVENKGDSGGDGDGDGEIDHKSEGEGGGEGDDAGPSAALRDFLAIESAEEESATESESPINSIRAFLLSVITVLAFVGALSVLLVAKWHSSQKQRQQQVGQNRNLQQEELDEEPTGSTLSAERQRLLG